MTTTEWVLLFFLPLNLWIGKLIADSRWREAAKQPMRVHSAGALYHVVQDGDERKAHEVLSDISMFRCWECGQKFESQRRLDLHRGNVRISDLAKKEGRR